LKWIVNFYTWQGSQSNEVSSDLESMVSAAGAIAAGGV
jgi:hypothetical protein